MGELEEKKKSIEGLKEDKAHMLTITQELLACRSPATAYALFLQEQCLYFQLTSIYEQFPYQFKDYMEFLEAIRESDLHRQHLMCELYMHGFILETKQKFNIRPFLGDIQLRDFVSFMLNQMKWDLAFTTFEANQASCPLRFPYDLVSCKLLQVGL